MRRQPRHRLAALGVVLLVAGGGPAAAQEQERGPDRLDPESTRLIREYTTDPSFLTEWVDHVPESNAIPSPRDFLGYVVGTPGRLTAPETIVAYFRELERTSARMQVFSMGRSHGGREMIVAAIAEGDVLARIGEIQAANRLLADPRRTSKATAETIARSIPPTYYVTAGLHSTETGPPEMVMELAYRLVVSDREHVREIRSNVLTLITPVLEMDGRARTVDWHRRHLSGVTDREDAPPLSPPYWGQYTFHDNNRDGLQVSQPLTRNYNETFHAFLPTVSLDLHESVPLLYVSAGTGPYNETIDPITVTEWQWMAAWDVSQATKLGLRGVWTWGFYTGWYPGYLLWVTNNHNAVGRFYETFGNGLAGTFERDLKRASFADRRVDSRQWYRAWPPERRVRWSLRNNTNYMQTGVLASLRLAARNGETLLQNFWRKGVNSLEKGRTEAPHAFHVPRAQRDDAALHHLLWLLRQHRIEVHRADAPIALEGGDSGDPDESAPRIGEGDFLVRLDQPYRNLALTLLSKQDFPADAEHPPYDDVSWSLPLMLGLDVEPVDDPAILAADATLLEELPRLAGTAAGDPAWLVANRGQSSLASLCWSLPGATIRATSEPWQGRARGSLIVEGVDASEIGRLAEELHVDAEALPAAPLPATVPVNLPRIALYHTWSYTQDSGWARYTLERLRIPYALIDKDDLRAGGLEGRFDVIVVPNQGWLGFRDVVHGIDRKWSPLAYTTTEEFPSHGVIDSSEDITGGMGFPGLGHLQTFVEEGGLLVTLGSAGLLATDSGIARAVQSHAPTGTPGSHVTTKLLRPEHPLAWGYDELTHVFHGNLPAFTVSDRDLGMTVMQYGTQTLAEAEREEAKKAGVAVPPARPEPRTESQEKPPLCLSGHVPDPSSLERKPAVLDVPVGAGRVLLFSWNPLHRYQNHHDFGFFTNALLFHDHFPGTPTEEEMRRREGE